MTTEVLLVAGMTDHDVDVRMWQALPGSALVRYDLRDLAAGVVRRWVDGELTVLELAHGCASCTLRLDLVPLLTGLGGRVVVHLDPALEPEPVCVALHGSDVRVEAVVSVVDRATWLTETTSPDALADRGLSAADADDRTVAQVLVGQAEFADALVLTGPPNPAVEAALDRLVPGTPRHEHTTLDVPALLTSIPPNSRRGRFDDIWAPPLRPDTPLHPAHGISVLRFTTERPFHPNRLNTSLDTLLEDVIRTRGRLHLASQPTTALWLESAGGGLSVGNLGPWPETDHGHQDLVIITTTRTPAKILEALHGALATDEELALLAPTEFTDPFAEWEDELEGR
ncbi:CobW family GTP-binding protein [Actinokineospora pegani]|uniref:CobW family GTP-binding protein n=1 Tax=Actinokineospora pegani TaxID=2654637 RepID=UPI001F3F12AD|nr:GTP-binding protein [Actinokineospora pegani]